MWKTWKRSVIERRDGFRGGDSAEFVRSTTSGCQAQAGINVEVISDIDRGLPPFPMPAPHAVDLRIMEHPRRSHIKHYAYKCRFALNNTGIHSITPVCTQ